MVYGGGLENHCCSRNRGFESLSLRHLILVPMIVPSHMRRKATPRSIATPEDILANHAAVVRELAESLRMLVRQAIPEATEKAYPVWRGIGYRHPKAGYFCAIFPLEDMVKLGFEYGALLPDPDRLLRPGPTKGHKVRYLEIRTPGEFDPGVISGFLRSAIEVRTPSDASTSL